MIRSLSSLVTKLCDLIMKGNDLSMMRIQQDAVISYIVLRGGYSS